MYPRYGTHDYWTSVSQYITFFTQNKNNTIIILHGEANSWEILFLLTNLNMGFDGIKAQGIMEYE